MSVASGITFHGFGNFVIPLSEEFGWNRTTISAVIAIGRLQSGLVGPLEGWAIDRFGPRRMMLIGVPLLGLGFVALSRIDSLTAFYAVYLLMIAAGSDLGLGTPMIAAVANWFRRRRGLAFGITWVGRWPRSSACAARRVDDRPLRMARYRHPPRDRGRRGWTPHRVPNETPARAVRLPSRRRRVAAGRHGRSGPRRRLIGGLHGP